MKALDLLCYSCYAAHVPCCGLLCPEYMSDWRAYHVCRAFKLRALAEAELACRKNPRGLPTVAYADAFGAAGAGGTLTYYLATAFGEVCRTSRWYLIVSRSVSAAVRTKALAQCLLGISRPIPHVWGSAGQVQGS